MSRRISDLWLVVGLLVGATTVLLVPGVPWPIEWAFGLPFLVAAPGYALVAALFPTAPGSSSEGRSPDWVTRAALSLVLSAVVLAVGGVLLATLGRLQLAPAVLLVDAVSLLGVGAAVNRRRGLARHADPVVGASTSAVTDGLETSRTQTIVLAVAVVALVGALAFAGGTTATDDPYSEIYLSTQGDPGDVSAANETVTLAADEPNAVHLTVANHEGATTTYGVVVQLQRVGPDGAVVDQQRLDRFETDLDSNETGVYERQLSPSMTGERLRLRTLVYKGGVPDDVGDTEADLSLRRWVTVEEASA